MTPIYNANPQLLGSVVASAQNLIKSMAIMRAILIAITLALSVSACQPDLRPELEALRTQVEQQQAEITRLAAFVDAQADVLKICENTFVSLTDYLVNLSTLGMLREASAQLENVGACRDAMTRFNEIAAEEVPK